MFTGFNSGFKNLYSKSVEAFKQVQDQVVARKPPAPSAKVEEAVPVVVLKTHPASDLLARYEKSWDEVTQNGATIKTKLTAEDSNVRTLADKCDSEFAAWNALKDELTNLEAVTKGVNNLKEEMEGMCSELQRLDEALDGHLKAKEERDLVKWKQGVALETTRIQAARSKDLEKMERTLKSEQDARIRKKAQEEAKKKRDDELAAKREAQRAAEEERKAAAAKAKEEQAQKQKEQAAAAAVEKENKAAAAAQEKDGKAAPAAQTAEVPVVSKEEKKEEPAAGGESAAPVQEVAADDTELEVDEGVMNAIEEKAAEEDKAVGEAEKKE